MKRLYSNLFFVAALCGVLGCHVSSLHAKGDGTIVCQKGEKPLVKAVRAFCVPSRVEEIQNLLNKADGYVQEVQNLLNKGIDDDEYNEAIKLIISELDVEEFGKVSEFRRQLARIFLEHKERCVDATYGLCLSSYLGDEKAAQYFITRGACVNSANLHKEQSEEFAFPVYPLTCAVKSGNISLVEFLINQGADIHVDQDFVLRIAFFEIITSGSDSPFAMFKALLRLGANLHAKQSYSDFTLGELFFRLLNDNSFLSSINNSPSAHPDGTILKNFAAVLLSHGVRIKTH